MGTAVTRRHDLIPRLPSVILDNLFHGLIAAATWASIKFHTGKHSASILALAFSFLSACAIDLDHFVAAGSLSLRDALNLPRHATAFHSVLFQVYANCLVWILVQLVKVTFPKMVDDLLWLGGLSWAYFVAWTSHLARDSINKGFLNEYLISFQTGKSPYWLYLVL